MNLTMVWRRMHGRAPWLLQNVNRRLREEQDAEYQRSLEADRERERRKHAASAQEEESKRAAEEEAAKFRLVAAFPSTQ
jgi:hypothetical protein